ncbi:MAG: hypothetical protein V4864_17010 [Pseudomonadota bacterium]
MSWKLVTEMETASQTIWTEQYLDQCDPYLVWADVSTYSDADDGEPNIAVLVELKEGENVYKLVDRMYCGDPPARFIPNQLGWTYETSFVTGIVSLAGLQQLINEVRQGITQRFTLQGARADLSSTTRARFHEFFNPLGQASSPKASNARSVSGPAYLGILDDGIPFLRARSSALLIQPAVHLWDQGWQREGMVTNLDDLKNDDLYWQPAVDLPGQSHGMHPLIPEGFLYGRVDKKPNIFLKPLSDRDEYAARRYVHPAPRQTHGASVLGLMAPWLSTRRGEQVKLPCDVAGLSMVQLPTLTVDDTSGGSLAMRVLDGIRHVLWQEWNDRPDPAPESPARPTVVNISYGIHGGPHDGSSMFERAAKEAMDKNEHLHLVLPMGNAHRAGVHARHCLVPAATPTTLKLRVMPDNPRDTFLEIWLPEGAEVELEIEPPGSATCFRLTQGQAQLAYKPEDGNPKTPNVVHFAGIYPARVADSLSGTMVLIAIGATRVRQPRPQEGKRAFNPVGANQQPRRTVIAPAGEWKVHLRNVTRSEFEVNAWIQRNDPAPDRLSSSRQAWFADSVRPEVSTGQAAPDNTMNGVATFKHDHLHVIGAMRANGRLSWYSAARPSGSAAPPPPNVVTVADWSPAVHGILSLGFTQGAVTRLDGTSAACAVYSRALAKQLADDPTKLPQGESPGFVEPEFDSGPEDEPAAPDALRGNDVRMFLPFDVEFEFPKRPR